MSKKAKLLFWLIAGILLAIGPFWGMLGTVVGMIRAFQHMVEAPAQPEVLASNISSALYSTAAGLLVCPLGIAIIVVSAIKLGSLKQARTGQDTIREASR